MNKVSNRIESLSIVARSLSVLYGFSSWFKILEPKVHHLYESSLLHQTENPGLIWSFNLFFKFSNPRRNLDSNAVWVWTCFRMKLERPNLEYCFLVIEIITQSIESRRISYSIRDILPMISGIVENSLRL